MFNRQSIVLDRRGSMNRSVLFHQAIDVGPDRNRSKMSTLPHEDSFVPIYTKRRDREFHLLIQALQQSSRAARRLPFEMDQDAFRVIVESVLDEPIEHAAGLDREDELRFRLDELDLLLLHVVGNCVACIAHVVPAVDPFAFSVSRDLFEGQVADHARPALFALRTPMRLPYCQTACFESNQMFAFLRSRIFIFGISPTSSSS